MKHSIYRCTACSRQRPSFALRRALSTVIVPKTPSNPNKIPLCDLTPADISYYWDTQAPNEAKLSYADKFFAPSRHSPIKIWSASKFRTTPMSSVEPEVAFLGRSNVGKSSLLNAIMGKEICWTSSKPGRTREMNAFGIGGTKGGEAKVVLLDMPGYGRASRTEWGVEIMKYLQGRRQLRRAFLLIDSSHGLKKTDEETLMLFRRYAIPHQVIMSKVDKFLVKKRSQMKSGASATNVVALQELLRGYRPIVQPDGRVEGPGALGEILTCSAETSFGTGKSLGISAIRWAILSAAGFDGNIRAQPVPNGSPVANISTAVS
ncbi:P-loop containing nucleoside triphosphate hydrolase protein [Aspergillus coremiiformis]|uniref:GTP-binding protein 8 n=1 Tax=Aspergillus coremiiformis TaxID=138285 RepID=A0A5N6ZDX3_9EURO|nr:P-loop containing nucleoside triphosphate hydrolase protein [Aspergillus coremiiformis]